MTSAYKYNFVLSSFGLQYLRPLFFTVPIFQNDESRGDRGQEYSILQYNQGVKIKDSTLGTPVFDNVVLADNLQNPSLRIELDVVLIDAELPKIIKKTQVMGRNGRIKEYIADDDWKINIKGAVFSDTKDAYPEEKIRILKNLARLSSEIEVASIFMNDLLGVDTLVIESFGLAQRSGMMNAQAFQLKCSSDLPYEIIQTIDNV